MAKISIELDVHEAILALGPIQDRALESSRLAAIATGDEREIADLSAQILNRVATRITDALYPDQCRWMDNEECLNPIERDGLCARHNRRRAEAEARREADKIAAWR